MCGIGGKESFVSNLLMMYVRYLLICALGTTDLCIDHSAYLRDELCAISLSLLAGMVRVCLVTLLLRGASYLSIFAKGSCRCVRRHSVSRSAGKCVIALSLVVVAVPG